MMQAVGYADVDSLLNEVVKGKRRRENWEGEKVLIRRCPTANSSL
jgi:hypothetical protein